MTLPAKERRPHLGGAAPLLSATAISVTGDGAFTAAAPLLASTLTTNPFTVSVVSAAFLLPWLLAGLPAGALADRWPRRRVMICADLGRVLVLVVFVLILAAGHATIAVLAGTVALVGIGQCFFDSAAQGLIPVIAGRDKDALTRLNGRFAACDQFGRSLAGPSAGAAAFAAAQALPFAVDAVSFLVSAALVRRLPDPAPPAAGAAGITSAIRVGLRFVAGHRDLRTLLVITGVNNAAFSIPMAVLVLYTRQVLHVPATWYGALLAAAATGGIIGGWWASQLTRTLPYGTVLAISCAIQATGWAGLAATGTVWVAAVMLALVGAAGALGTTALLSARQQLTPDDVMGRVVSVFRLVGVGIAAGAALLGGAIASGFGLRTPLLVAAVILTVLAAGIARTRRAVTGGH